MSKLTLFLLLALTIQVLKADLKVNNQMILQTCHEITIDGVKPAALIEELEEDYCSSLKTNGDYTHCCLFEFSSTSACYQITDDQYENIGRFKKYLRDQLGDEDLGIECSSRFISFSLLAVLALLF